LHVLTNHTRVATSPDRYAITMDLDTRGLASVFVDLTSHSQVQGRIVADAVHPEAYRGDVRRNGIDHHYRVDYRPDGAVVTASLQPTELRGLVAADHSGGAVDQLTAYFIVARQLARRGSCALTIAVFDGHGRYDLRFSDAQPQALPASDNYFSGPTQLCSLTHQDIRVIDASGGEAGYRGGKIWYARLVSGDQMVPVRMEFDTEFGVVRGYLAELHGRGVDLRLMQ